MFRYKNKSLIFSYIELRRLIGILGILLPFICIIGGCIISKLSILESISYYYYTNMRDFFVGLLFLVSMFLITYRGYEIIDNLVTTVSGIAGLGIAIFPCLNEQNKEQTVGIFQLVSQISNNIHLACASIFFIFLAINSIFLFTLGKNVNKSRNKMIRKGIYIGCGIVILLSLITLFIILSITPDNVNRYKLLLVFEIIMLMAFGISWLVKGETLFKDKIKNHERN